jgi:hypothetical protein
MSAAPISVGAQLPNLREGQMPRSFGEEAAASSGPSFAEIVSAMQMPPATPSPEPAAAAAAAEMFNEHGFLGRAAAWNPEVAGADAPPAARHAVENPIAPAPTAAAGLPAIDAPGATAIEPSRIEPARRPGSQPVRVQVRLTPAQPALSSPPVAAVPQQAKLRPEAHAASTRTARAEAPLPAERQPSLPNAALAVHVGPDGLQIVARAADLAERDRLRLRVAIASLLSRHGFSARSILLNGVAAAAHPASERNHAD